MSPCYRQHLHYDLKGQGVEGEKISAPRCWTLPRVPTAPILAHISFIPHPEFFTTCNLSPGAHCLYGKSKLTAGMAFHDGALAALSSSKSLDLVLL